MKAKIDTKLAVLPETWMRQFIDDLLVLGIDFAVTNETGSYFEPLFAVHVSKKEYYTLTESLKDFCEENGLHYINVVQ